MTTEARERPILFSGPMVRAILEGRKTQTRRVAKLTDAGHVKEPGGHRRWHPADPEASLACPYGQPGDALYVREAWAEGWTYGGQDAVVWYRADGESRFAERPAVTCDYAGAPVNTRWRPSIHMPTWAARLWLRVEDVRVERLQEITREGAIAEGAFEAPDHEKQQAARVALSEGRHEIGPRDYFRELWDSINGKTAPWKQNPFVWVVEFSKLEGRP